MEKSKKQSYLYRNTLSYAGAYVSAIGVILILFTVALDWILKGRSNYIGIFIYFIFPGIFVLGVLIVLYGMRRESLRRRRLGTEEALPYPRIDLNDGTARKRFVLFVLGGVFILNLFIFLSYNAYIFLESDTFCGALCHTMTPEYVAYQSSPHARIQCVHCHVGSGAKWFVKYKLNGAKQFIDLVLNTYPRPIPTPLENLRPARDICEECHWPSKFFGTKLVQIPHFRYDEKNTPEQITLGMKTGGWGLPSIHNAHLIASEETTFVALDSSEQDIPWVKVKKSNGSTEEYLSLDYKGTPENLASLPMSTLDCIGCHNRPAHVFFAPDALVNMTMTTNLIPRDLPWIKKVAVDALFTEYPDRQRAHEALRNKITGFYRKEYPKLLETRKKDIEGAISTVITIYDRTVFPSMKVDWKTHPSNNGHTDWPGCFRCHDNRHVSKSGKTLSMDCTVCHTMPVRGPLQPLGITTVSSESWHPMELRGRHGKLFCTRCHSAGTVPSADCATCHRFEKKAPMMSRGCSFCHQEPQQVKPVTSCNACHAVQHGLHRRTTHSRTPCTECHKPHLWTAGGREGCLVCHSDKKDHNTKGGACAACHDFRGRSG